MMENENLQTTTETKNAPESQPEKAGFSAKDLENKSHEEQIAHLDNALLNLDIASGDLKNSLAESELERSDRSDVIKESSIFDRTSLKLKEVLVGEKAYDEKLSNMAKKVAGKNLDNLERGLGADVLNLKKNIETHETTTKKDLELSKGFFKPEELADMESKLNSEKEVLVAEKDQKEKELEEKVKEYPAEQKYEKINGALGEYSQIESSIKSRRSGLEADIKRSESVLKNISNELIKENLKAKVETLKQQAKDMQEREKLVKARILDLTKNKKELEPFVNRLRSVGKTKTEILAADKERAKKEKENPINIHATKTEEKIVKPLDEEKLTTKESKDKAAGDKEGKKEEKKEEKAADKPQPGQKKKAWAPKPKKVITEAPETSADQKENIKLQNVKKTPKQWGADIQNTAGDLLKLAEVKDVRRLFNKRFEKNAQISGLEAANYLRELLRRKMTNANEKARMAVNRIIK